MFAHAVHVIDGVLWGHFLTYILLAAGIFFTLMLTFIQFRWMPLGFRLSFRGQQKATSSTITSFQSLATSLASRVGTGNLAGVAIAIHLGGPGALFWMWASALLGMSTAFVESTLGQLFKRKGPTGLFRGGPAYYLMYGLRAPWAGFLFSIILVLCFGFIFVGIQSNTISHAVATTFHVPVWITALVVAVLALLAIHHGIKAVAKLSSVIVPIMIAIYLVVVLWILVTHIVELPGIILMVFSAAFGAKAAIGGGIGYMVAQAMTNGVRRGLFSNEAGLGSVPNIAATANVRHPVVQGLVQMTGVVWDTIFICSATGFVILLGQQYAAANLSGIELSIASFGKYIWGGGYFIDVVVFLLAFSTIVGNYAYVETNVLFLFRRHPHTVLRVMKLGIGVVVFVSGIVSVPLIWDIGDIGMGVMALFNLVAILLLFPIAWKLTRDFFRRYKKGEEIPLYDKNKLPIRGVADDVWNGTTE